VRLYLTVLSSFRGAAMRTQLLALAIATPIFCFVQINPPALAQAGSTGGTVGKQDKSVSGTVEPSEPKSHGAVSPPRGPSEVSCKWASVWANEVAGLGSSVWTISSDGSAIERGFANAQGHASLSGRTLAIIFRSSVNNGNYVMRLNRSCTNGSGKVTVTNGIGAGVYSAIFTRTD
jgi:hypothetical protein